MTLDMNNTDKLNEFRLEARRLGIEVVSPDVNRSGVAFEAIDGRIVYALAALKGVGTHAVEHLVAVRGDRPFADLADFAHRVDPQIVNRKALECLVQAGAFDSLDPDRAKLFENIGRILAAAQERSERSASGIVDLFGGSASRRGSSSPPPIRGRRRSGCSASSPPSAPISARIRSTTTPSSCSRAAG